MRAASLVAALLLVVVVCQAQASVPTIPTGSPADNQIEHKVFGAWCAKNAASQLEASKAKRKAKEEELTGVKAELVQKENSYKKASADLSGHNRAVDAAKSKNDSLAHHIDHVEKKIVSHKRAFHKDYDKINWDNELSRVDSIASSAAVLHDPPVRDNLAITLKTYKASIDKVKIRIAELTTKLETLQKDQKSAKDTIKILNEKTKDLVSSRDFTRTKFHDQQKTAKAATTAFKAADSEYNENKAAYDTCVRSGFVQPPPPVVVTPPKPANATAAPTAKPTPKPTQAPKSTPKPTEAPKKAQDKKKNPKDKKFLF